MMVILSNKATRTKAEKNTFLSKSHSNRLSPQNSFATWSRWTCLLLTRSLLWHVQIPCLTSGFFFDHPPQQISFVLLFAPRHAVLLYNIHHSTLYGIAVTIFQWKGKSWRETWKNTWIFAACVFCFMAIKHVTSMFV